MIKKCKRCRKVRLIYAKELCHPCYQQGANKKSPNFKINKKKWGDKHKDYWKTDKYRIKMRKLMRKRLKIKKENYRK